MSALLFSRPAALQVPAPARHKRVLDVGLIVLALPVLLPVVLLLALAIKLTSPGPVLFFQTRVGRDGRRFRMVKFRSMYPDAETRRAALLAQSDRAGLCFKHKDDPRVTKVGRILRRSSLDELPQLWNVLRGEMSLVGPRPALPEEVALYSYEAKQRLAGLPGLTGLWQVSGRANIGFDEMVAMDLRYLQEASLRNDLMLIFRTFEAVALARGAY
ncbi:MAG: sugar transferase [Pseudotabrizicola sp.]|uniref:sugar transferase n=1 Tax=Pseudotabrizicola sp. TaxID=2939647 RepID=UPI00271F26B2|nr:sugar transferase [Pseudotabrizicola sp.]MDO8884389.1 sugar transferase [Pseudotabrizicola sp.]MDP2081475.1 sugar transferase [Pseudotabrizicola sp.]MDZ7572988.1 sugar transferase [Pseudotabrizicola sp.]